MRLYKPTTAFPVVYQQLYTKRLCDLLKCKTLINNKKFDFNKNRVQNWVLFILI